MPFDDWIGKWPVVRQLREGDPLGMGRAVQSDYSKALKPQSWAAAAPLLVLRTLLGLDVVDGRLRSAPRVPRELGRISLRRIPVRGRRANV